MLLWMLFTMFPMRGAANPNVTGLERIEMSLQSMGGTLSK
jgi:hypothetical protein